MLVLAISQESMRYVALDTIPMWIPPIINNNPAAKITWEWGIQKAEETIKKLQEILIKDNISFTEKKFITSHIRRLAPMGIATAMVWTVNVRSLRHIIQLRTSRHAKKKFVLVFHEVANIVLSLSPSLC